MKFDIKEAVSHIFNNKNLLLKIFIFCTLIFVALALGVIRMYITSEFYFDDFDYRLSLASTNFKPYHLFQYLGFPIVSAYSLPLDILQLLTGGSFDIIRVEASLFVLFSIFTLSLIAGYFLYYAHNYVLGKENKLPELKNVFTYFKKGLEYFAICFILTIPILIINLILIKLVYGYFRDDTNSDLDWFWAMVRPMMSIFCINILATVSFLYLSVVTLPYTYTLQAKSVLNFKKSISFVYKNIKTFCKYLGFILVFTVIFAIFATLMACLYEFIMAYQYDFNDTILVVAVKSFITSAVVIAMSLPCLFWYIATITNLHAQLSKEFLNHAIAVENSEKSDTPFKKILKFIGKTVLLIAFLILAIVIIEFIFLTIIGIGYNSNMLKVFRI